MAGHLKGNPGRDSLPTVSAGETLRDDIRSPLLRPSSPCDVSRCWYCSKTFGRLFILKRHEKMHTRGESADPTAPTAGRRKKAKCACTNCQASKQACDDADTCEFCAKRGLVCERIPKPVATKRKTGEEHSPDPLLIPQPPADKTLKHGGRRRMTVPAIAIPGSMGGDSSASSIGNLAAKRLPDGNSKDDHDVSEAPTLRTTDTDDTMTLNDGYLSDSFESSPMINDDDDDMGLSSSPGGVLTALSLQTTMVRADEVSMIEGFLNVAAGGVGDDSDALSPSSSGSLQSASPNEIMLDDEMAFDDDEEEEERLREQEQLLLIEQETMLRLEEQQRMNEQNVWHMQQMMSSQHHQSAGVVASVGGF